jgi:EAL domain-containing protein (putative c-di-GMP-specific phosphodiesterase class I)/GGDEF domain-containing protein
LIVLITLFIYLQKGTKVMYPLFLYIPIILCALFFKLPGGLAAAVICGLLMGPFMPLNASTRDLQSTGNWLIRIGMYSFVGGFVGLAFNIADKNLQKIEWQALHTISTDLPNRFFLSNEIQNLKKKMSQETQIAVFAFEVINYQDINMTIGYENADKLMCALAENLQSVSWNTQICELGSYLLGAALLVEDQQEIIDRINEVRLLSSTPITIEGVPIFTILKMGIDVQDMTSDDQDLTIMKSISAAHRAKVKNLDYRFYSDGMDDQNRENMSLLGSIPKALSDDEFTLYYQPIIDLANDEVMGFEALIRWFHQRRGLISPGEFIHLLEVTPLVNSVQDWVIKSAVNDATKFMETKPGVNISINISPRGINQFIHVSYLENILSNTSILPENIIFEITESVAMDDAELALEILRGMKAQGIKLAIDDFGVGYSSLNYLKFMPIDLLKIDRSFIADAQFSKGSQGIINAIIAISKSMDFKVLAEGVETQESYNWLRSVGCDYMQGFYKARPMPLNDALEWLKNYQSK